MTSNGPDTETRLAALEARLHKLEDEQAIAQLIASYGPLVDAGEADARATQQPAGGSRFDGRPGSGRLASLPVIGVTP